ncbi:MAG: hypothetical protein ACKV2T_11955, partial [Kofleriaceae bacterium]
MRQSAQMELVRFRKRHRQHVARAALIIVSLEHTDQRPTDEHARRRATHDHRTVRRESTNLEIQFSAYRGQRQLESFHRRKNNCHCLRIPTFLDLVRCRATARYPITSSAAARTL